jgi:hypothetical protein
MEPRKSADFTVFQNMSLDHAIGKKRLSLEDP